MFIRKYRISFCVGGRGVKVWWMAMQWVVWLSGNVISSGLGSNNRVCTINNHWCLNWGCQVSSHTWIFSLNIFTQSPSDNVKPFPHLRHNSPSGHCHLTIPTQRIKATRAKHFSRFYLPGPGPCLTWVWPGRWVIGKPKSRSPRSKSWASLKKSKNQVG